MRKILLLSVPAFAILGASAAWAHPQHGLPHVHLPDGGFATGVLHPFLGLDHLLAMAAVGILAARFGKREMWFAPAAFVLALIAGGCMAFAGGEWSAAEGGIALSLIALGAAVAVGRRPPLPAALAAAAAFGFVHGFAHGAELPSTASPAIFALGFTIGTCLLHGAGFAVGWFVLGNATRTRMVQVSGVAIAGLGLLLLSGAV